ncbi:GlsB/YeaQ/YmgE family stress response membrane protein [Luteimonas sp. BDR2-5]|uniref:GlsB/YeaQ/YmgE family stress response membrane protein n=1 Tax=Proluteimonas luteida TaxID=2878685 RepID=UPI001E650217|nr:GlsB/YeaQ/YmgE family stress response membrane protein [Luteimonas sp. BDR2-5]MCD9029253.1 GlsB/YeaQ/YmgE family stress response membrane protein [Luteimonas sp. BDR2-5]
MEQFLGNSSWLWIILIGLLVGMLARLVMPGRRRMGLILTTLLGIGGAIVASWLGQQMGWYAAGQPAGFLGATLGAMLILGVVTLFRGR